MTKPRRLSRGAYAAARAAVFVGVPLLAVLLLGGCPGDANVSAHVPQLGAVAGGARPLSELDLDADKDLDGTDAALFAALGAQAEQAFGGALGVAGGYYAGPPEKAPSVFAAVKAGPEGYDLSAVPKERLRELAIESRWLARQVRVAVAAGAAPEARPFGGLLLSKMPGYSPEQMPAPAVCEALRRFDLTSFTSAGLEPAAVFDLDSTVWDGNVSDAFLAMLAHKALPKPETHAKLQAFLKGLPGLDAKVVDGNTLPQNVALLHKHATDKSLPPEQQVNPKDAFFNVVALIAGLTEAEVAAASRAVFEEGSDRVPPFAQKIYHHDGCGMGDVIEALKARGIAVYILTATPDFLALEAARVLGVPPERAVGSVLVRKDGRYTGEVGDSTYYTKGAIVRQWLGTPPLFVFGDSPASDFSMLQEAAAAAFMLNPRDALQARDAAEAGARMVGLVYTTTKGAAVAAAAPSQAGAP